MPKLIGSVFGLSDIYALQKQNLTTGTDDYWPVNADHGIYVEGMSGTNTATQPVTRFEFSSETSSSGPAVSDPAPVAAGYRGGISDSKQRFGWFIAGLTGASTFTSRIVRMDLTGGVMTSPQAYAGAWMAVAGLSNNAYGYGFGGGSPTAVSTVRKFDYSTETLSPVTNLPASRQMLMSFGDRDNGFLTAGTNGYPAPTKYSNTTKIDYSTDTFSAGPNHPITSIAQSSSWNAGYFGLTFGGGATTALSGTTKFDYTNETYSALANMPQARRSVGASGNNIYGYLLGGSGPAPTETTHTTLYSNYIRYDYDTNTYALPGDTANTRCGHGSAATGGVSRVPQYAFNGYITNGYAPTGNRSSVYRHDFDSDTYTTLNPIGPPAAGSRMMASTSEGDLLVVGGTNGPTTTFSNIDKFSYSTETSVTNYTTLPSARGGATASENASSGYAYFHGGLSSPGSYLSSSSRLDTSLGLVTSNTNLPAERGWSAPSSEPRVQKSYLFGGDQPTSSASSAMKFDWSSETYDDSVNMPSGFYNHGCIRNNYYTWIVPGEYGAGDTSSVYRWDFSTDTRTTTNPIGATKAVPTVTWSNYAGYIGGGILEPASVYSYNMSTETSALATSNIVLGDTGKGTNTNTY